MKYQTIIVEKKNRVGKITLNRPEVRNVLKNRRFLAFGNIRFPITLSAQLESELLDALLEMENDPDVDASCASPAAVVSQSIGVKKCLELMLTGDPFSANEMERAGLVNRVVPKEELESAAMELAEKIANKPSPGA